MAKSKKTGADAVQEAALGHNKPNKEVQAAFLEKDLQIARQIQELNDERKENLRDAKDAGMSKQAIRAVTKEAFMSKDALAAKREVESEKIAYQKICKEVGLFDKMQSTSEAA